MTEAKIKKPRGVARFHAGKCVSCGERCASACPVDGIAFNDAGEPVINEEKCIGCDKCVKVCGSNPGTRFFHSHPNWISLWINQLNLPFFATVCKQIYLKQTVFLQKTHAQKR